MEHVVFFPTPDGGAAFRRFAVLDEAVRFVEHLRNVEGVSEVSLHALTEVPLAFRAYYKVEVPAVDEPGSGGHRSDEHRSDENRADENRSDENSSDEQTAPAVADVPAVEVPAQEAAPVEAVVDAPLVEAAAASPNGKRSLGFFAH